jgi:hypothetical protein
VRLVPAAVAVPARRVLRAIDVQTGKVAWELPQMLAIASGPNILAFGLPTP